MNIRSALERVFGGTPGRLRAVLAFEAAKNRSEQYVSPEKWRACNPAPTTSERKAGICRMAYIYDEDLGCIAAYFDDSNNIVTTGASEREA